jgi:pimeloyl-ACP methyl ester carboxylesterase
MTAIDLVTQIVTMSRDALVASGLERRTFEGSVYFASRGESPAPILVLLHGTNDQAGSWARVVPALAKTYRLIVPDLAGHGDSEPLTGPIPISTVVDHLHRVLDHEHAAKVTLAGNSFGGWIALLYALAHPQRVERLVLEAGGGLARPLGVPLVAHDRETAKVILRAVHGPSYVPQEWALDAVIARATGAPMQRLEGVMENFLDARLSEIHVPTTLIWGADDGVVPLSYGEALRDAISGAELRIIEGAAHIPHLQQPERFVECLTATS